MRNFRLALLIVMCGFMTDAFALNRPDSQVTFRVHDTNVMLLVKSSALSYAGRKSGGKNVTLFWSGRVEDNGAVILNEPSSIHSYAVILEGAPGSHPELSVELEGKNIAPYTIRVQPPIAANGRVEVKLWFKVHDKIGFIILDPSSHWLPPPRSENPRVQASKGQFVLLWKQPQFKGMSNSVSFDVRWSTGRISKAEWVRAKRITDMSGLQQVGESCWMDVSPLVEAGARSFAIRAIDSRNQDSPISEPALVDSDADGIPDVWEIERFGNLSMDAKTDTDKDHVPDYMETFGLDPDNPDSDGDGLPDGWELGNYLDPRKPDSSIDSDGDGFSNLEEYKAGTDIWDSSKHPLKRSKP